MWVWNPVRIWLYLKMLMALGAVCACISGSLLFISLRSDLKQVTVSTVQTETQAQQTLITLNGSITNLNRTILITGGAMNQIRDSIKDSQETWRQANQATLQAMQNLVKLEVSLDTNQQQTGEAVRQALDQVQKTVASVTPVMEQTNKNLVDLQPSIKQMQVLMENSTTAMKNTSDVMANVAGITADTHYEIHKFVYPPPQPWYGKYILNPIKIGLKMVTIPLRK